MQQKNKKNKNHLEIEEKFKFNISNALFEHVHNKIIHFPISLALAAFLFSLFGIRDNRYDKTIKILLLIAGIFGIAAFLTGLNQFAAFEGEPKQWVAENSPAAWNCICSFNLALVFYIIYKTFIQT